MIEGEEFEKAETRTKIKVLKDFLELHKEAAYTRKEIASIIDQKLPELSVYLCMLKKKGLIEHKNKHWKWKI